MTTSVDPEAIVSAERAWRDRDAARYEDILSWGRQALDATYLPLLALEPEHTVVDAGCGTGRLLPELLRHAGRVIGVDHSRESVRIAAQRIPAADRRRAEVHVGDVRRLPVEDDAADRVLCAEVIQHVPTDAYRDDAVRELRRVLRPGGTLVISTYRWLGHVKRHKDGFWGEGLYRYAFTPGEFRRLLERGGFDGVDVRGASVLPSLSRRLGLSVALQRQIGFAPIGRYLGDFLVARALRPPA